MFGRTNNSQNKRQQPIPGDENVRKEAEFEEDQKSVQPMGNEAANVELMNEILNEPEVENRLNISDENIENFRERPNTGKKKNLNPDKLLINYRSSGNDLDNSNNINNINNENSFRRNEIRNDDSSSESEEDLLNINTDPPKEKKKKGKKKPDKEDAKAAIEIAEEILEDDPDQFPPLSTYAPDEDLMAVTGPKKNVKKKGSKSSTDEIKPSKAGVDNLQEIGDARWKAEAAERIKKIEDKEKTSPAGQAEFQATEMNKLKNWNFAAEKLDKVKKPGKFSKLLTYAAAGIGKILSLALQIVSLGHFWRAKSMARFDFTNTSKWQTSKDNQNIPGWDGAKFDRGASGGKDIMADFRRVPTVWSQLTAAKAVEKVEKDGKEEEKPLDPVVSVMIDQPDPDTGQDMVGREFGHAMLGIEYSRKSNIYDRYERYKLQYGFYPAGKTLWINSSVI